MGWLQNFIFGTDPAYDDAGLPKQVRDWEEAKNSDMSLQPDGVAGKRRRAAWRRPAHGAKRLSNRIGYESAADTYR